MPGDTGEPRGSIRTFLIADVRGYTLFTQERGDEAAAKLASRFAGVVRDAVERRGGALIELRGDEALVGFDAPRQAIRAAVELQERFVEETLADPSYPLTVGIGLDAGEAVAVEGGYRGGALNLAARLCGQARAGECLATHEVVHLAGTVEAVRYAERGALSLKGMAQPVPVVGLLPADGDPAERLAPVVAATLARQRRLVRARTLVRQHRVAAALVAVAVIAAVTVPLAITGGGGVVEIDRDAVGLVDLDSGEIVDAVELEARPGAVASGEGAVWVTQPDEGTVAKIDPRTRAVIDTIEVGSDPTGIAVGGGSVWVANAGAATLSRISPETNQEVQEIDAPSGPAGIAVGAGGVWVASTIADMVSRFDPESGNLEDTIAVGDRPTGVAVGRDGVWVTNFASDTVSRIDPATGGEVARVDVGGGPTSVAVGLGSVWVSNSLDGTVSRIDPTTPRVTQVIQVGEGPSASAVAGGVVWITNELDGTVTKVDPGTNSAETMALGSEVAGTAVAGGFLWVGVRAADASHRGGTLTVLGRFGSASQVPIDPAVAYNVDPWSLLSLTNDGLVGFRRVGGLEGDTLVPNLASAFPVESPDGLTYTFQLRRGIRYSTGEPVRPEDFRRAIERIFAYVDADGEASGGVLFFSGIVGTDACEPGNPCDLSRGIVADDDAGTVTFHLREPDPEFLYKLAIPFAFAVPADTPDPEVEPVPATGPYMIVAHSDAQTRLERNPYFREWSAAAHPDGFPDRIVVRYDVAPGQRVGEVLRGGADLMFGPPPTARIEALRARYPAQVHAFPTEATFFMGLNVSLAPFDDVRVRRAVNYAVDRERLGELTGGQGTPTCQILPPNYPAYERYCPYTRHPSAEGWWEGPDMAKALRLVDVSGTAGTRVTVWTYSESFANGAALGRYVSDVLGRLGYRATLKVFQTPDAYWAAIFDPANQMQIVLYPWMADYPTESGFIATLFRCDAWYNLLGFCDPALDEKMDRATALLGTDPSGATSLWQEIERNILDQAPVVPLVNGRWVQLVSERVGNYQPHPQWGVLIDQLWVR